MKKSHIAFGFLATMLLGGGLLLNYTKAYAQETGEYPPLVDKLAEHFGLDKEEVLEVFEEHKGEVKQEIEARHEEHLNQLVEEGVITQEQKDALIQKHEEMRSRMEELHDSDLMHGERHEAMKEMHEEFQLWLQEQGINEGDVFPRMGGHRLGKIGGGQRAFHL